MYHQHDRVYLESREVVIPNTGVANTLTFIQRPQGSNPKLVIFSSMPTKCLVNPARFSQPPSPTNIVSALVAAVNPRKPKYGW